MKHKSKQQPVILLVDGCDEKNNFIKDWLASNDFLMCETTDVLEALETISDFTLEHCPDVIMLHVDSPSNDFDKITEMVGVYSDSSDILIATLSGTNKVNTEENLFTAQLSKPEANVNGFLPALSRDATRNFL
jgi:hypothetical protein